MRTKRKPKYISEVPPIHESTSHPHKRENFRKMVEFPLLKACERLYDLNVYCYSSSANKDDVNDEYGSKTATIAVSYHYLSEHNKKVADGLVRQGQAILRPNQGEGDKTLTINIPIDKNTTARYVEKAAMRIANKFEKQDINWTHRYKPEELTEISGYKQLRGLPPEQIAKLAEGFYDKSSGLIYLNEEHYKKALKYEKWAQKKEKRRK